MPRSMVGLLAAVGTAMSALVNLSHGDLISVMITSAAAASGLAAYLALPAIKNLSCPFRAARRPVDARLRGANGKPDLSRFPSLSDGFCQVAA